MRRMRWTRARRVVSLCALTLAGCAGDPDALSTTASELDISQFVLPDLSDADRAAIVHRYDEIDPTDLVPRGLLEDAIVYYDMNLGVIPKPRYFVVVDFSLHSGKDRYWLVDTTTGGVEPHKVAHGDGTDPDNNGFADTFGNVDGSHKSSLGFYLTGEIYDGTHAHSMRLDGLSAPGSPNAMANTNVRSRLIVVHEADYVDDSRTTQQGRSNGCLALDPSIEVAMVDRIHDGSLIYTAIAPLWEPVGRTTEPLPGGGSGSGSGSGPDTEEPPIDEADGGPGGCSTTGGHASLGLSALGLAALLRRRKRG